MAGLRLPAQRQRRTMRCCANEPCRMAWSRVLARSMASFWRRAVALRDHGLWTIRYSAGTQGVINHKKKDRLLTLARNGALPVVLFAGGGGGRPGDEWPTPAGLDTTTFHPASVHSTARCHLGVGRGPLLGNAALLVSCDVIIAAEGSNIGMGGPP